MADVFDGVDGLVWLIKSVREFGMSRHRQVIDRPHDIKKGKIEFLLLQNVDEKLLRGWFCRWTA